MNTGIKNILFISLVLVGGCSTNSNHFAPVTNGWTSESASSAYRVQPDDTVYSIAFRYGMDYRKLVDLNHLSAPYHLVAGQNLSLSGSADNAVNAVSSGVVTSGAPQPNGIVTVNSLNSSPKTASPAPKSAVVPQAVVEQKPTPPAAKSVAADKDIGGEVSKWQWPADGKITQRFSSAYGSNKGIDISGRMGSPVRATAAGKVVYAGLGLKGYGLLIIIKHNSEYLSAYAHNSQALVKEGDAVKAGQKIALMGDSGASKVGLHFEIRKAGKPIDPLTLLSPQK